MHEIIETHRPTIYYGVPTLYAAQLKTMDNTVVDLSSIRIFISAGEALPPDLLRRWTEKTGAEILDGIGTTEILHIFLSNRPVREKYMQDLRRADTIKDFRTGFFSPPA